MLGRNVQLGGIILLIFCLIVPLTGQQKTLNRHYDPIILRGKNILALQNMKISEWTAYQFSAPTGAWQPVPFQIDEVDDSGNYFKETDGILDDNDELVFMPGDAGDRAGDNQWLQDSEAIKYPRLEIEVRDPNRADDKAWIYLYQNVAAAPETPGYFQYRPASDATAADTIITQAYKIAHNRKGWTDFLALSSDYNTDLIDRIMFHIRSDPKFIGQALPPIILTEDTLNFSTDKFYLRPVRSFQKVKAVINLVIPNFPIQIPPIDDTFLMPYYPYSNVIGAGFTVDAQTRSMLIFLAINKIRLSMDFDTAITRMKFFSANNRQGIAIDGISDNPITSVNDPTDLNWVMASGPAGTIIEFFKFPNMPNSTQQIYYYDNATALGQKLPDSTVASGDGKSMGDMGLMLSGQALIPASDSLFISFNAYFIDVPDQDGAFANQLLDAIKNPVTVQVTAQWYISSVSDSPGSAPGAFDLCAAYPNPFNPTASRLTFRLQLNTDSAPAELKIFNLLGQEVYRHEIPKSLVSSEGIQVLWDGRLENGSLAPAGVYFYRLMTPNQIFSQKLVMLQ